VTVAVLAHYDPENRVRGYVRRQIAALADISERVVVVSTADLLEEEADQIRAHAELIQRPNAGYDFASYRAGLERLHYGNGQQVIIVNDSCVGPLRPWRELLADMNGRGIDLYGGSLSLQHVPHVQSYCTIWRPGLLDTPAARTFWVGVSDMGSRETAIESYELGLGRLAGLAGWRIGAFFEPNSRERRLAAIRCQHAWSGGGRRALLMRTLKSAGSRTVNEQSPVFGLWDRALTGRLPFVKIRLLRDDPLGVGRDRMLKALEARYPEQFAGVRSDILSAL
jgi:lipopolysaccharide biosynthesis protein